jgi:hypothetical protein
MADTNTLAQLFAEVSLGEELTSGNLTLVPLLATWTSQDILPMSVAMTRDEFAIKEMEGGASVSELRVVNRLEQPVLLMEGEELVGALQNRVVNSTILIAPNSETVIPVSCDETSMPWREHGLPGFSLHEIRAFRCAVASQLLI